MDLCNYQAKSHRDCMQISESDHCDSDLTENQSDYNTPHHKISRFSILISIGTWENRGQTDALPVTAVRMLRMLPSTAQPDGALPGVREGCQCVCVQWAVSLHVGVHTAVALSAVAAERGAQ